MFKSHVPPSELWKLHRRVGHMIFNLLCRLSGLGLDPRIAHAHSKLIWLAFLADTASGLCLWSVWLHLRRSQHLLLSLALDLICLGFRGSMFFCHWETLCCCPLEWGTWFLPSLWLDLRGSCASSCIFYIFLLFCCIFIHIYLVTLYFSCYTSLYLIDYAWHYARMSKNEMWNSFVRPCWITYDDYNVEHILKLDNSINYSCSPFV
jgi:hypothetical protein